MADSRSFNAEAEALKKGDGKAAERIFDHFAPHIHSFFMARIRNRETAQDLTQEVFLKVIRHIETFDARSGEFTAWIWQIARNTGIDFFRQKKPVYLADLPEEGSNIPDERLTASESAKLREILKVVERFSPEEQELFELHFIADLSYVDMAHATGRSSASLRVAIHRLRKKIQPYLND